MTGGRAGEYTHVSHVMKGAGLQSEGQSSLMPRKYGQVRVGRVFASFRFWRPLYHVHYP